jgi:hypothetical protein
MFMIAFGIIVIQHLLIKDWTFTGILAALVPIPFIQNMFFTWVSRSRQGGDPDHHRYAAWGSNGVWAVAQAFVAANIYVPVIYLMSDDSPDEQYRISKMILSIIIYSIATTEGSVLMMKIRLNWFNLPKFLSFLEEKGKTKVGER